MSFAAYLLLCKQLVQCQEDEVLTAVSILIPILLSASKIWSGNNNSAIDGVLYMYHNYNSCNQTVLTTPGLQPDTSTAPLPMRYASMGYISIELLNFLKLLYCCQKYMKMHVYIKEKCTI
jgi:hypothetical protein